MAFDIKRRATAETFSFQLADADDTPLTHDDGTPVMAEVHGPGSRTYAQAAARRQGRVLKRLQQPGNADAQARETAEFLADITVSLDLEYEGLEGRAKLVAIYTDTSIGFVAEQVARKAADWGNFAAGSSTR
jgi:hypothetical protein